jgi:hypothetical protein
MSRRNEVLDAVTAELDAVGIGWDIRECRHYKVAFILKGKPQHIVVPRTPSDHRAPKSARAFVRRLLRGNDVVCT